MDLGLSGKVAIVTGGGQGVGEEIAATLSREGAAVVVNDLFPERAEAVAAAIRAAGGKALGLPANVVDWQEVSDMVKRALSEFGRIDILVNNAGLPAPNAEGDPLASTSRSFSETGSNDWAPFIDVNLYGTMNCTRAVIESMIAQKSGRVICIISDAARVGEPKMAAYAAGKAGIVGFAKSLAKEVARYAINVNCVALATTMHPAGIERQKALMMATGIKPEEAQQRLDKMLDSMTRVYPLARGLGRLGLTTDGANAVAFLASDAAPWITGQVLGVDGGFCMAG